MSDVKKTPYAYICARSSVSVPPLHNLEVVGA